MEKWRMAVYLFGYFRKFGGIGITPSKWNTEDYVMKDVPLWSTEITEFDFDNLSLIQLALKYPQSVPISLHCLKVSLKD